VPLMDACALHTRLTRFDVVPGNVRLTVSPLTTLKLENELKAVEPLTVDVVTPHTAEPGAPVDVTAVPALPSALICEGGPAQASDEALKPSTLHIAAASVRSGGMAVGVADGRNEPWRDEELVCMDYP